MPRPNVRDRLLEFTPMEHAAKAAHLDPANAAADPRSRLVALLPEIDGRRPGVGGPIPESVFLRGDADVAVVKHARYLPAVPHTHQFIELSYVYEGACRHELGDTGFTMDRGDLTIVAPGLHHAIGVFEDDSIVVNILVRRTTFDRAFFELIAEDHVLAEYFGNLIYGQAPRHPAILLRTGDDADVRRIVEDIYEEAEGSRRYRTRMLNLLVMGLCTRLVGDHERTLRVLGGPEGEAEEPVFAALRHLQANFRDATLRDVAARYGYSEAHFSRLIRRATGRTFSDIVRELRVRKAAELFANASIPVNDVVEAVGYTDVSHFYRSFRKFYGVTPAVYRRQLGGHGPGNRAGPGG